MEDRAVAVATKAAITMARRWGRDHRELLGACWEAVARAGPAAPDAALVCYGCRGAIDFARVEALGGWGLDRRRRERRLVPLSRVLPRRLAEDDGSGYGVLNPAARPEPAADRALSLWCECRESRAGWTWRQRVAVYLYAVEGLTLQQVAACFGLSYSGLYLSLRPILNPEPGAGGPHPTPDAER